MNEKLAVITVPLWTDVATGCLCRWTTRTGQAGWALTQAHPGCRAAHEEGAAGTARVTQTTGKSQTGES